MNQELLDQDRRSGTVLLAFVAVQLVYLVIDMAVLPWPAVEAPIGQWRPFLTQYGRLVAGHVGIAQVAFVFLFLPGVLGLRRRLRRSASEGSLWPDLVAMGGLLVLISVFVGALGYATLGLIPAHGMSASVLSAITMGLMYDIFGVGSFAIALFTCAASAAILQSERARWLAWWGFGTAAASLAGTFMFIFEDFDGPWYGLTGVARASFLAWVVATGLWLRARSTTPARSAGVAPADLPAASEAG